MSSLETRQAPPEKPGAEKAKIKGVPQMPFFSHQPFSILGRGGGGGGRGPRSIGTLSGYGPLSRSSFLCICTFCTLIKLEEC